jgi:hypothetical protein
LDFVQNVQLFQNCLGALDGQIFPTDFVEVAVVHHQVEQALFVVFVDCFFSANVINILNEDSLACELLTGRQRAVTASGEAVLLLGGVVPVFAVLAVQDHVVSVELDFALFEVVDETTLGELAEEGSALDFVWRVVEFEVDFVFVLVYEFLLIILFGFLL